MNKNLDTQSNLTSIQEITKEIITEYLDAFDLTSQLQDNEKKQFVEIAFQYKLNPFKREIYCVVMGEGDYRKVSIITGYETYIKRAERTGKLDGWKISVDGSGKDMKAIIIIYRKDWKEPFQHEVYFEEAVQKKKDGEITRFWKKQPKFQLKKVAISQGFRLCFPDELGGLPYDFSEVQEEINQDNIKLASENEKIPSKYNDYLTEVEKINKGNNNARNHSTSNDIQNKVKTLIKNIEDILIQNESLFPPAHIQWVKKQLKSNPYYIKLEGIYEHLVTYVNNNPAKQETSVKQKNEALVS